MVLPLLSGTTNSLATTRRCLATHPGLLHRSTRGCHHVVRAAQEGRNSPQEFGLAPAKPKTAWGEMLQYYLRMEPQLFKTAVEDQLLRLREEKEQREQNREGGQRPTEQDPLASADLVLYRRMEEVRASELRATLEDLMFVSILERFLIVGVDMLPRMDGYIDVPAANLLALTEGIHSKEALELVREHLRSVMGPSATNRFSTDIIKMSKFQMAQVYAASIMFGYFLRRVDRRFQLEKAMGMQQRAAGATNTSGAPAADAVSRLERLFAQADSMDTSVDPDAVTSAEEEDAGVYDVGAAPSPEPGAGTASSSNRGGSEAGVSAPPARGGGGKKSTLRAYVEGFDQAAMMDTARIISQEGAALVERQTTGLFGDIKLLTKQMQEAVGADAQSIDDLYQRIAQAVQSNAVETVTMSSETQKRAVLEAVAYGAFMRETEDWIASDYDLLTPMTKPKLGPGSS